MSGPSGDRWLPWYLHGAETGGLVVSEDSSGEVLNLGGQGLNVLSLDLVSGGEEGDL